MICDIGASVIGKGKKQERGAQESSRKVPVARLDIFDEFVDKQWLKCRGRHLGVERDHVGGLRSRANLSVTFYVRLLESCAYVLYDVVVAFRVPLLADSVCHLRHHVGNQGPIRGCEQILVRMLVGGQPVSEVWTNSVLTQEVGIPALNKIHPT